MKNFKNRVDSRTWGVLGKQQTFYAPTQFLGEKVPLNANAFDSWDYKKSKYKRIDLVPRAMENDAQQAGVVPQGTPVTPTPTPSSTSIPVTPSPTPTQTGTPTSTPTSTPTPSLTATQTGTPTPTTTPTPTSTPAPFDADAAAYLSVVLSSGGTLSPTISAATNTLFTQLKSNNLYSKIDVMYPMLGSNAGGNGIDAKNPVSGGYPIQWFGGMLFSDKGAIGNGSNAYGTTYFIPNVSSNPLNYGWGIYMYDDGNFAANSGEVYNSGAYDGTYLSTMRGENSTTVGLYGYGVGDPRGSLVIPTASDYTGNYAFTFNSSKLKSLYRNYNVASGTTTSLTMAGTAALSNQDIYVFVLNLNGTPYIGNYWSGTMSFYWIGESMTTGEVSTLSTIINTFQTTLGRNTY